MTAESIQTVDVSELNIGTLVADNPVLVKHVRSRLRQQQIYPAVIVTVILAALITWACFKLDGVENGVAITLLTAMQGFLLFLVGTSQVATAVADARSSGILDFHRISPVRSVAVTLGFIMGAPIREWVLFACILPFSLACIAGGNPTAVGWLEAMFAVVLAALVYHTMAALIGATSRPRAAGGTAVVVTLILLWVGWLSPIPTFVSAVSTLEGFPRSGRFFNLLLPHFALGLLHQVPLLIFVFIATVRKIRQESAFVYSRPVALLFFAVVGFFVLADTQTWPLERRIFVGVTPIGVSYIMTVVAIILISAVTPSWGAFANGIRRARKFGRPRPGAMSDFASNLAPVAALALITFAAPVISNLLRNHDHALRQSAVYTGLVGACTVLFFGCVAQGFGLQYRRTGRPYLFVLLFIYWIVPILLAMIAMSADTSNTGERTGMTLLAITPLAGIGMAGGMHDPEFSSTPVPWMPYVVLGVPIVTALLAVIFSVAASRNAEREVTTR